MGIFAGFLLLCILVVVHELGHFLFAKWLGVRVLTFSVGFGPKIWSITKGDTEYALSAIPLGGYVKMFGESYTEVADEDQKYSFMHQPLWKKSLIAFAGPLFNFILPLFLFFFMFWGTETVVAPVLGTVFENEPAEQAGLEPGDKVLAINGESVQAFSDLVGIVSKNPDKPLLFSVERLQDTGAPQKLDMTVTPVGEASASPMSDERVGRIGVMPVKQKSVIVVNHPQSEAAKAGLQTSDEILAVDGRAIQTIDGLFKIMDQKKDKAILLNVKRQLGKEVPHEFHVLLPPQTMPNVFTIQPAIKRFAVTEDETEELRFIEQVKETHGAIAEAIGELSLHRGIAFADGVLSGVDDDTPAMHIGLKAGDRIVSVDGKLVLTWVQILKAFEAAPDDYHLIGVLRDGEAWVKAFRLKSMPGKTPHGKIFGQQMHEAYDEGTSVQIHTGLFRAVGRSFEKTADLVKLMVKSLGMLVRLEVPMSELGGPIAILGVAGKAAEQGLSYYVYVMALLSVNLGLLNLLPVPVLDGGHLLLFGVEAVIRRPLSLQVRQRVTQAGMLLVLFLMAIAIYNDLSRLFM